MTAARFRTMRAGNLPPGSVRTLLLVMLGAFSATAPAQPVASIPAATQAAAPVAPADGDENKTQKPAWVLTPRLTLGATYSDNAGLSDANKRADWIAEISPGLRLSGESARLKAFVDYTRRELMYARDSDRKNSQNSLNAFGTFKAVEQLLFVDFSAGISQQAISAFGTQSSGATLNNANETETRTVRLSPYLKGELGGFANYELRYSATSMRTASATASGMDQAEWLAKLEGSTPFSRVQWAFDAAHQTYDYTLGRETESSNARLRLSYLVDTGLKLTAIGGREENNFISLDKESHNTSGFGLEWNPTTRTRLFLERERRFFGNSHRFSFSHRTPRTAVNFSDTRNVAASPNNLAGGGAGNIYDLLFQQMASVEPDPVQRDILVNNFLQANGIAPNTPVTSGFLNSGPTVSRQQTLSFAWLGVRNTLTLTATQGETQRLGLLTAAGEDLAASGTVRQRGVSLALSHKLSALSNLNFQASRQSSSSASGLSTSTRNFNLSLIHKLGPNTAMTVGMRRVLFDNQLNPYTENAFLGTLRMQF